MSNSHFRVGFAGTPAFAAQALSAILDAGFNVPLVLTQPDRPSGRGLHLHPSAVKSDALAHGIAVLQPVSLKSQVAQQEVMGTALDVLVVAAYGLLLPQIILDWPRLGCLNIHASLLPRWRGAAPIQRAIAAGDSESGICIMQMDAGLDTGPVLDRSAITIAPDANGGQLHDALAKLGAERIVTVLHALAQSQALPALAQSFAGITYAHKLTKADSLIDWSLDATRLVNQIRAFDPTPGASTFLHDMPVKIWRAEKVAGTAPPGSVIRAEHGELVIACAEGALRVLEIQKSGGKRLLTADFLRGNTIAAGDSFGS